MARLVYNNPRDYENPSRYNMYRTIVDLSINQTYLESVDEFNNISGTDCVYHVVEPQEENRLDIISNIYYKSSKYYWLIALANNIIDPMTVVEGTVLLIPSLNGKFMFGGRTFSL